MKKECSCKSCQSACTQKPGWFKPGEAEKAAEFLKLSLPEFFKQYIGVDWYEGEDDIFVLAPALVGEESGKEYPGDPRGTCVFFSEDLCTIHSVKPFECASYVHDDSENVVGARHREVSEAWVDKQDQIKELLGREPETEEYSGGMFGFGNFLN